METKNNCLMLLTNAFMPDPRVYNEAKALIKAGYNVTLLCWDRGEDKPEEENIDGINVKRVFVKSTHGRGSSQLLYLRKFWKKAEEEAKALNFDIIHAHDFDTQPLAAALAKKYKKIWVFDSHEVYSATVKVNPIVKAGIHFLEDNYSSRADCVFVTCPQMMQRYKNARRVEVIGNYKEPKDFEFDPQELEREKEKLGATGKIVISYIANLGRDRLVEPILDAVKENQDFYLLVGGEGVKEDIVKQYAQDCPNIKYLGYVSQDNVPLYTAICDIVYYGYDPSVKMSKYASPNKLFEAIAAGKALLCSNVGEIGEVVRQEQCGIALNNITKDTLAGAMRELKNPGKIDAFKQNSARAREKYNWQAVEKRLVDIYGELLEN